MLPSNTRLLPSFARLVLGEDSRQTRKIIRKRPGSAGRVGSDQRSICASHILLTPPALPLQPPTTKCPRGERGGEEDPKKKSSRDTPEGSDPLRVRVQGGSRARVGVTIQSRGADHRSPGKWSSVTFKCCCCFSSPFFEGKVPEQSILELFIHLSDPGRVRNSPEGGKKKITQQASNHAG